MVLQGETSSWLKITLRQVYRDVSLGETPIRCVPGMLLRTGTPLWDMALGRHGWRQPNFSSTLKPASLHHENSGHLLLFPTSPIVPQVLAFLGLFFFFIEETEKWCEEESESRNSHLPSSSYSLSERQGRVAVPYTEHGQPAPAVVPPRRGRVTSYTQEVSSGVSCLSVSLVPFQSPSTPWCISFLSQCSVTAVRNHKSSQAGKICFIHSFCINLLL